MRVFLLGLDGMTLRTVEPYVKADLLPNFKKIMEQGCYGILRSTIPSSTGPGWVSLATGKNPGKHGIYEFRKRQGYKVSLNTRSTSQNAEPLWDILSRNGAKVIMVNVPFSYPPNEVNGIMISGLMTPGIDTDFVFPKKFKQDIFKLIPDYQIDIDQELFLYSKDTDALLNEVLRVAGQRRKLMDHLLENKPWDFFFITFTGPDRIQHFLWNEVVSMDPKCVRFYKLLDDILGDILQNMDDDMALFVASDHGFMEASKSLYINNFLRDLGLLKLRKGSKVKDILTGLNVSTTAIRWVLKKMGLLSLKKLLPSFFLSYIRKFIPARGIMENEIDWANTKAFSLLVHGLVSINLKEREPNGIVERQQYDEICDKIRQELLSLKDPETGKNVVGAVFRGNEIYSPQCDGDSPDLLVVTNEGYSINENVGGNILGKNKIANRYTTGHHQNHGIFLAYGNIINNKRIDADIYDIMPTILYLMGKPIPEDVDGQVLTEVIRNNFVESNKIRFEKTTSRESSEESKLNEEETEKIERQLRNLGYIE